MKMPSKRSPWWPALLSALVIPGLGQIYNRQIAKGVFLMGATLVSFVWFSKVLTEQLSLLLPGAPEQWAQDQTALREALTKLIGQNGDMFMTFQVLMIVLWGFGIIDAYLTARERIRNPLLRP